MSKPVTQVEITEIPSKTRIISISKLPNPKNAFGNVLLVIAGSIFCIDEESIESFASSLILIYTSLIDSCPTVSCVFYRLVDVCAGLAISS